MAMIGTPIPQSAKCKQGADYVRTYTRVYAAYFGPDDDEEFVRLNLGFGIGGTHPTAPSAWIIGMDYSHETECETYFDETDHLDPANNTRVRKWTISAEFGPRNPLDYGALSNPLLIPPKPRLEFFPKAEPAFVDLDGEPILNAAFDYYDPPVMIERLCMTLSIRRNEATVSPYALLVMSNRTNAQAWNGFPVDTVRSLPIRLPEPEFDQESGVTFYPMEYVFEIDEKGWKNKVLNQGYSKLDADGFRVKIVDKYGQDISAPALLDGEGEPLATPIDADDIVHYEYRTLPSVSFAPFNLGNIF